MGGETAGVTEQAQGERIFLLSTHQILMPSLLSWGGYWPAPLLQSPENQRSLKGPPREPLFSGEGPLIPYPRTPNTALAFSTSHVHPSIPPCYSYRPTNHNPTLDMHPSASGTPQPQTCHTSLRLLFFLLLFSPEELSSLDTNSLLLKLSLSCLDEDLDDEPLEGVDFFSTFTFTFFFFFDLSLKQQEGKGPGPSSSPPKSIHP